MHFSSLIDGCRVAGQYTSLVTHHPKLKDELEKAISGDRSNQLKFSTKFKALKEQLLCIDIIFKDMTDLDVGDREHLIEHILKAGVDGLSVALKSKDSSSEAKGWRSKLGAWFSDDQSTPEQKIRRKVRDRLSTVTDSEFLGRLDEMLAEEPLLQELIVRTAEEANDNLQGNVKTLLSRLVGRSVLLQHDTFKAQIQRKFTGQHEEQRKSSRLQLFEEYEREIPHSPYVVRPLAVA
jgi:hypothetical protein